MEGLYSVFLWRGHFAVDVYIPCKSDKKSDSEGEIAKWKIFNCFKKTTIYLPLSSMILFVGGVTLVESPTLIIPYFFGTIGCIMLALMTYRNTNPYPWSKTKTFDDFLSILIHGKQLSVQKNDNIEPNQNLKEATIFKQVIETRLLENQKEKEEQLKEYNNAQQEQIKFNSEVTKLTDKTKVANREAMLMAPFKSIIYPYQLMLANVVYALRFTSSVFLWENSFASFWITFGCFALFFVCLIIPWSFILTWTCRILVWTLLGPWIKFADM